VSHVVHLFHPEVVVLGGGLSLIGDVWRNAVASALRGFLMEAFAPGPAMRLAALGEDAVPVGTLLLAQQMAPEPANPEEAPLSAQPFE
jgi:glucokinase